MSNWKEQKSHDAEEDIEDMQIYSDRVQKLLHMEDPEEEEAKNDMITGQICPFRNGKNCRMDCELYNTEYNSCSFRLIGRVMVDIFRKIENFDRRQENRLYNK